MAYVIGTDIHSLSRPSDWTALYNAGCKFIFIKASENNFADKYFSDTWQKAKDAGLLRGAYHFFHPEVNSSPQIDIFTKTVGTDKGELPPVCDLETVYDFSRRPLVAIPLPNANTLLGRLKDWLDKVEQAFGCKPIIYTRAEFVKSNGISASWLNNYPLWLAQYPWAPGTHADYKDPNANLTSMPTQPNGFQSWSFWQWSGHGRMGGFPSNQDVDFDYFNGSYEELSKWANDHGPTPKPNPDPNKKQDPNPDPNKKQDPDPDPNKKQDPDPIIDATYILYTVRQGDDLGKIAQNCITIYQIKKSIWTLVDDIVKANPDKIKTKQTPIIPNWELKIPKS
jgi:GH25 family lysozyme M1 (1,4-beta-N-acetylmuramidase)